MHIHHKNKKTIALVHDWVLHSFSQGPNFIGPIKPISNSKFEPSARIYINVASELKP